MVYILMAAGIFLADFLIKNYAERKFSMVGEKKKLKGFLGLRLHHNRGAFMNVGQKNQKLIAVLSACETGVVLLLSAFCLGKKGRTVLKTSLAMVTGGALSNTYDRLKRKYVVDYFSFGVKWKLLSRMVFNISDFCIIIGCLVSAVALQKED